MIEHFASSLNRPRHLLVRPVVLEISGICMYWNRFTQDGTIITPESLHQSSPAQSNRTEVSAVPPSSRLVRTAIEYIVRDSFSSSD